MATRIDTQVIATVHLPPGERMGIQLTHRQRGRVRYKVLNGDDGNNFHVSVEKLGDFVYLQIRVRNNIDVTLNRELRVGLIRR